MKKNALLTVVLFVVLCSCKKQFTTGDPDIQWSKIFGGSGADLAYATVPASNGGFMVVGYSNSNDGDLQGKNHCTEFTDSSGQARKVCEQDDGWVINLNPTGEIVWQNAYGEATRVPKPVTNSSGTFNGWLIADKNSDQFASVVRTKNGKYIIAGHTNSQYTIYDQNFSLRGLLSYPTKVWLAQLDENGKVDWQNILPGRIHDSVKAINTDTNGGFVITGVSDDYTHGFNDANYNSSSISYYGSIKAFIVTVDPSGKRTSGRSLGGNGYDKFNSVIQINGGDFIAVGQTNSIDEDLKNCIHHGGTDVWVAKLKSDLSEVTSSKYGGEGEDVANCIAKTDDGFIVAGKTNSNDGDVTGNHSGKYDAWVIKFDHGGNKVWQKTYGGAFGDEMANSIIPTTDGGFVFAGSTSSNDGDVSGNHGYSDAWVVKIDKTGNMLWQKTLGGNSADGATNIIEIDDGGLLMTGYSFSNDGNISRSLGNSNYWVVKLIKR